jgi:hypothetical protein
MKKILFFLLLFISLGVSAQRWQVMPQAGYGPVKKLWVDSVLILPTGIVDLRDFDGSRNIGQIRYNEADSSLYIYTGYQWLNQKGSGGSTDTTSLSNRINLKADKATTITINGVTYDLSANRTWTLPDSTLASNGLKLSGKTIKLGDSLTETTLITNASGYDFRIQLNEDNGTNGFVGTQYGSHIGTDNGSPVMSQTVGSNASYAQVTQTQIFLSSQTSGGQTDLTISKDSVKFTLADSAINSTQLRHAPSTTNMRVMMQGAGGGWYTIPKDSVGGSGGTPSLTQYRLAIGDASNQLSTAAAITGNRAVVSNSNGVPVHSVTTATEVGYLNGVRKPIQVETDNFYLKTGIGNSEISSFLFSGNITEQSAAVAPHWWDDGMAHSLGDTLYTAGGWYTNGSSTWWSDSIYYSIDKGVNWTLSATRLPFSGDAFSTVKSRGYIYIIGAGSHNPSLTQTVWRTNDMVTFTVMTSAAGWGSDRYYEGSAADEEGNLYVFGGQRTDSTTIASCYNDVWKSTDYGATWTRIANNINVGGTYFLGQVIQDQIQFFNNRFYAVGGGFYGGAGDYSNKVFSAPLEDLTDWRQEDSIPAFAVNWGCTKVWDGKIWNWGGVSHESGNSNEIYYMDKHGTWHQYLYTYLDNNPSTPIGTTHATNLAVMGDALYMILGNTTNNCYAMNRSLYQPSTHFRDSVFTNILITEEIKNAAGDYFIILNQSASNQIADWRIDGKGIIGTGGYTPNTNQLQVSGKANITSRLGIGVDSPLVRLHVVDASGGNQMRIEYNSGNYYTFNMNSANLLTVSASSSTNASWRLNNTRNFDVGVAPVGLYAPGSGYPGIGFNLVAGNSANAYTFKTTDDAYLIELGRGGAMHFNMATGSAGGTPSFNEIMTMVRSTGNIGIGNSSPNASAKLDITSTTQGLLLPRMTATQASAITPVNGLLLYVTNTNGTFTAVGGWLYVAGAWTQL